MEPCEPSGRRRVSPGFRLRPSLSAGDAVFLCGGAYCVAGVQTPAFVERFHATSFQEYTRVGVAGVQTPAFVERPWIERWRRPSSRVSPGFRLRPSLSGPSLAVFPSGRQGVAGVQTPAFVERSRSGPTPGPPPRGVAGVQTPAFVERSATTGQTASGVTGVAGVQTPAFVERIYKRVLTAAQAARCRWGSDSGLR